MYFKNCKSLDEAKKLYRRLSLENHPDRGGDLKKMQEINRQYQAFLSSFRPGKERPDETTEQAEEEINLSQEFWKALSMILPLEDLTVELVGSWLWATGNTYQHRGTLSLAGFKYAKAKKAWFFTTDEISFSKKRQTLDEIKYKYGAHKIKKAPKLLK